MITHINPDMSPSRRAALRLFSVRWPSTEEVRGQVIWRSLGFYYMHFPRRSASCSLSSMRQGLVLTRKVRCPQVMGM